MSFRKKRKRRDGAQDDEIDVYKPKVKRQKCDNNSKIVSFKQLKEKYDEYLERTGFSKTIWFLNEYEILSLKTFQDLIKAIRQSSLDQEKFPTNNVGQIINTFHCIGEKLKYYWSREKKEKNFKIENSVFKGCYTMEKNNQEIYYRPTTTQAVQLFAKYFLNKSNKIKSRKKIKMKETEPFLKGLKPDRSKIIRSDFGTNREKPILVDKNRRQNNYFSEIEKISSKKVSKMTKKQNKKGKSKPKERILKFKHFLQDLKQKISSISGDQKDQDAALSY
jgi:hypothetical protein